jgi:chemotaxis protein methyltransferase CheR
MKPSPPAAADVERFAALVRQRLGLQFEGSRLDALGDVLHERMAALGADGPEACFERVGAGFRDELRALAEKLTVGETFFFRNPDQLRALAEAVLPERLQAAGGRPLRLLSAGCASGEEPLTLAMVARQRLGEAAPVTILGVDVNAAALARAARGRYSAWSLRQTPPDLRERHFRPAGRDFAVDEAVRRLVVFEERNLVDDGDPWPAGSFDVIFCRNVIMYFAAETALPRARRDAAPAVERLPPLPHPRHLLLSPQEPGRGGAAAAARAGQLVRQHRPRRRAHHRAHHRR